MSREKPISYDELETEFDAYFSNDSKIVGWVRETYWATYLEAQVKAGFILPERVIFDTVLYMGEVILELVAENKMDEARKVSVARESLKKLRS